jgi:hypothetical protein
VTNYERLTASWSSNIALIEVKSAGSAANRALKLQNVAVAGQTAVLTLNRNSSPYITAEIGPTGGGGTVFKVTGNTNSAASGLLVLSEVSTTINQSGTAGYTGLKINITETATGSGAKLLTDWQVGGVSKAKINNIGTYISDGAIRLGTSNVIANPACLTFASNTRVNMGAGALPELDSTATFSMAFWYNTSTLASAQNIFVKQTSGTERIIIQYSNTSNNFLVLLNNGGATSQGAFSLTGIINANEWHHFAVVYDGAQATDATRLLIYVDGVARTVTFTGTIPSTTGAHASIVPYFGFTSSSLIGKIRDFHIYTSVISAANVATIYNNSGTVAALVHRYKFEDASGSVVVDSGSNPQNGSITIGSGAWSSLPTVGIGQSLPMMGLSLPLGTTRNEGISFGNEMYLHRSGASVLSLIGGLTVTGHLTLEGVTSTGATGTGKLVFDTGPTFTTATAASFTASYGTTAGNFLTATGGVNGEVAFGLTNTSTGSSAQAKYKWTVGTAGWQQIINGSGAAGATADSMWIYSDTLSGAVVKYSAAGDSYFYGNVSALSFTDRTPFYEGDALAEIMAIKGKDGEIDHKSLPEFVQTKDEDGEDGRDLGAMISVLTVAMQQLSEKVAALELARH